MVLWDFSDLWFQDYLLSLLVALVVLVIGWLVALLLAWGLQVLLGRLKLDARIARWMGSGAEAAPLSLQRIIGRIVFYVLMLVVLVAFFQTLKLEAVTQPLSLILNQIFAFAPRLIAAGALLLAAWIVASLLRLFVVRTLNVLKLDQAIREKADVAGPQQVSVADSIGSIIYWLVFLLFLPVLLDVLALQGLLGPVQGLIDSILGAVPQAVAAALIFVVGWLLARVAQRVVQNLLVALGIDRLGQNLGAQKALGQQRLSSLGGLVVYLAILIPAAIAALDALGIKALSDPAIQVLGTILSAVPPVLAAGVLLAIAYAIGKVASAVISRLLEGMGFNHILTRLGFRTLPESQRTPAELASYLVMVAIMLFASIEAARLIGFVALAELILEFTRFAGRVLVGLAVFALGLYLSRLAYTTIVRAGSRQAQWLALSARVAVLVLAAALALGHIGVAGQIVVIAFTALFGALALALAIAGGLAFGLGARDSAGQLAERWLNNPGPKQGE